MSIKIALVGVGEQYEYIVDDNNYIQIDPHAIERLVKSAINKSIHINDDHFTIWTYEVDYRTTRCNGVNYTSDIQTIAYHSQAIIEMLEKMTEEEIINRHNELFWNRR